MREVTNLTRCAPRFIEWKRAPEGWAHTQSLMNSVRGRYRGHRCILIGNGPSLRKMDLAPLKGEYTFGLNRIYLLFKELGFETDFLVATNRLVISQFRDDFLSLGCQKFIHWDANGLLNADQKTAFVCPGVMPKVHANPAWGYRAGHGTVTNVALEIAYYMGFEQVILIGVDHNFADKGTPHKVVEGDGNDRNHFAPNYFGKGVSWQLPDLEASERGFRRARALFEKDGREVLDCTVDGKLQIFKKADFGETLLSKRFQAKRA
jgi:hypothetical protein